MIQCGFVNEPHCAMNVSTPLGLPRTLQHHTWWAQQTRCWKCLLQHSKCIGDANKSGLPMANKYLFADLSLFESREGNETTSPSFSTANTGIDAFSALLAALIAT